MLNISILITFSLMGFVFSTALFLNERRPLLKIIAFSMAVANGFGVYILFKGNVLLIR